MMMMMMTMALSSTGWLLFPNTVGTCRTLNFPVIRPWGQGMGDDPRSTKQQEGKKPKQVWGSGHFCKLSPAWDPLRSLAAHSPEPSPTHQAFGGRGIYPWAPGHSSRKLPCKRPALLTRVQLEWTQLIQYMQALQKLKCFTMTQRNCIKTSLKLKQFQGTTLNHQFVHEAAPYRYNIGSPRKGQLYRH